MPKRYLPEFRCKVLDLVAARRPITKMLLSLISAIRPCT
jgi:hypothetical protein